MWETSWADEKRIELNIELVSGSVVTSADTECFAKKSKDSVNCTHVRKQKHMPVDLHFYAALCDLQNLGTCRLSVL